MKKLDFGQAITILANLGVISGIIFLGMEIQQNNRLLSAEAEYNYLQNRIDTRTRAVTDEEFARLLMKRNAPSSLNELERFQLVQHAEETMLQWQWEWSQMREGNLEADMDLSGREWVQAMRGNVKSLYDEAYEGLRSSLRPEFVAFLEAKRREAEGN